MGVGNILQRNISNSCQSLCQKTPQLPALPLNLEKYNQPFANCMALLGIYFFYKSSVYLTKKSLVYLKRPTKMPTTVQLQQKYGDRSWALIVDCRGNEEYCVLLAKNGFSLILCGQEEDIKIVEDRLFRQAGQLVFKVQTVIVDWQAEAMKIKFYQQLSERLKDYDISFMVMPTINKEGKFLTHEQKVPVFEHIYLMARQFGPKLNWRPYVSAIIIPSTEDIDQINGDSNGVTRAVQSGVDAFGRVLWYELGKTIEIIVARGSAQNAFIHLGKSVISH